MSENQEQPTKAPPCSREKYSRRLSRRTVLKTASGLGLVFAGGVLGTMLARRRRLFKSSRLMMGTIGEIQVVHDDPQTASRIMEAAFAEAMRVETLMTRFDPNSEIGRVNDHAFRIPVTVSPETAEVVRRGLHWAEKSEGWFDPAIGRLSKFWDLKPSEDLQESKLLESLTEGSFFRQVVLDEKSGIREIQFLSSGPQLDLGGIAKGYAVDRAIKALRNAGINQGLVNLGGDLKVIGGRTSSSKWRVGIKNPNRPDQIERVLELRNQAVATSGNYEKFRRLPGEARLVHHLIDPFSRRPGREGFHSLTVIGDDCMDADALATGLFFHKKSYTQRFLEDHLTDYDSLRLG